MIEKASYKNFKAIDQTCAKLHSYVPSNLKIKCKHKAFLEIWSYMIKSNPMDTL